MTWDEKGIALAECVAKWSKDPSTKVGAAIFDDLHCVVGIGYNGLPRGVYDDEAVLNDRKRKYPRVVHAEANALLNARPGGTTLYCTLPPCSGCAGLIIQYGIKRIVSPPISVERWADSQRIAAEMFQDSARSVYYCNFSSICVID